MALSVNLIPCLASALIFASVFGCISAQSGTGGFNQGQSGAGGFNQGQSGAGGFNQGQSGAGGFNQGQSGAGGYDPPQIVAKALLCFHDKYIYSSCEESYRLTESGNLEVPSEKTEEYCSGPCLTETNLVLDCIDNILSHFVFYNRATIQEVRETVQAGCGYGPERGDFNVEEHIESEESNVGRFAYQILVGLGFMLITHGVLML
ncbi:hypothetical protein UlMin_009628 [Ulmus minor]